jgi:hypothetical protein
VSKEDFWPGGDLAWHVLEEGDVSKEVLMQLRAQVQLDVQTQQLGVSKEVRMQLGVHVRLELFRKVQFH